MSVCIKNKPSGSFEKKLLTSLIFMLSTAPLTHAQDNADKKDDENSEEQVIVTGYKQSLKLAIERKAQAIGQVDAIIAEDIADFPDLNLAESMQRIPGVAITRDSGEGKNITVRGLSGLYTRVLINGMEARAGMGNNNTRNFDFNMFASELFNSLEVHKTASASLEEGSLGATIKLQTAQAFDYQKGHTGLFSANSQYNDLSEENSPRLTGLYAYHDPNGLFGFSASVAYSQINSESSMADTVRWERATFNSVRGESCADETPSQACAEVSNNFHTRIPRYGKTDLERNRLGITLGAQLRPMESTTITFDAMISEFDEVRDFRSLEVLFRGQQGDMDVLDYTLEPYPDRITSDGERLGNGTLTSMTVDNAFVRAERYHLEVESEFSQYTLKLEHAFSDNLSLNALFGIAGSEGSVPKETALMYDDRDYDGFRYDYSRSSSEPILHYGGDDVSDPSNFQLTVLRDGTKFNTTDNNTAKIDLNWTLSEALTLSGGINYRVFELSTRRTTRNGDTCSFGFAPEECNNDDIPNVYGIQGTQELSEIFTYTGPTGPGSTVTWASPSLAGWTQALNYYAVPLTNVPNDVRDVEEKNAGIWLKASGQVNVGYGRFLYDVGVRYVETDQSSSGLTGDPDKVDQWVTVERPTYDYTLPSINLAYWVNSEVVLRASWADTIARPSLVELTPGGSVSSFSDTPRINFRNPYLNPTQATNIDFSAEWYFAEESLLSLAIFNKDIDSFPETETRENQTFASSGLPTYVIEPGSIWAADPENSANGESCGPNRGGSGCWTIRTRKNGKGAEVFGWELGLQTPFSVLSDNLPPVLSNMGFIANYTYADSDVVRKFNGYELEEKFTNLSNTQYNATVYYEDDRFSTRLSASHRGEYIISGSANRSGNLYEFVEPSTYLDYSASYQLNDQLTLSLEVVNLLDTAYEQTVDETANRNVRYELTGRNILFGLRYRL